MPLQFTLTWINTAIATNDNVLNQTVSYRPKTAGGAWITAGFTPANNMNKTVNTADTPNLVYNIVYEFKVETLCTLNGPTINDDGIEEAIGFECITPDLDQTYNTATITLNVTGLDITKARFTLRKSSNNAIIMAAAIVNRVSNSITKTATGLLSEIGYYWQVETYANVNNTEEISSDTAYFGKTCTPYPITTDAAPVCDPITAMTVASIEI